MSLRLAQSKYIVDWTYYMTMGMSGNHRESIGDLKSYTMTLTDRHAVFYGELMSAQSIDN